MAITAAGAGSGLDIEGLVSQLMQIERQPIVALDRRESEYKADLSAYGRLKGAVSSFKTAMDGLASLDKFKQFTSTSTDESVVTASADSHAAGGTLDITVSRLAQNHKQASDAFADSQTFGGAAGDALTLTVGAASMTLDLSTAQTLSGIRDAINTASDNPGITATLLNADGGQQRLILTSDESGYDQRVQLSYGGSLTASTFNFQTINKDSGGAVLSDLTQLDASFSVDGFAVTRGSNSVSDVLSGVTFDLKTVGSARIDIARDTAAISDAAQAFADAYNGLVSTLSSLGEKGGDLNGDSTLRTLEARLRGVLNQAPAGITSSFTSLSEVGLATQRDGTMEFDSAAFESALNSDFQGVAELFANDDQGFAFRLSALADDWQASDGIIANQEKGLNDRVDAIEQRKLDMEDQLALKEKALRAKYGALDALIGGLKQTSNFLSANLR